MRKRFKLVMLTLAVFGLLAGVLTAYGSVSARGNAATTSTTNVMDFQDHGGVLVMNAQQRGTSDMVRGIEGISMNIDTTDLPVGAYSLWYVIFNDPSGCSDGECGENDVLPPPGTPDANVSVLWATGGVVGPDRVGHFSASLGTGVDAALGQVIYGDGLVNPMGAEIHVIVRYHGPALWNDANELVGQMSTLQGFCTPDSSLGIGTDPNAFACFEPQVAIHSP